MTTRAHAGVELASKIEILRQPCPSLSGPQSARKPPRRLDLDLAFEPLRRTQSFVGNIYIFSQFRKDFKKTVLNQ